MAALPDNDRIAGPFIALAGQTVFPGDFPLIRDEALRVRVARAGSPAIVLSPPDVTATDRTGAGFNAVLTTPLLAGDQVWVYSDLAPARMRQHTPNGAVRTVTLEDDATEAQAQLQEVRRDLSRALLVQPGETAPSVDDLAAAANAGEKINEAIEKSDAAAAAVADKANRALDNAQRIRDTMSAEQVAFNTFLDQLASTPLEYGAPSLGRFNPLTSPADQDDTEALMAMQEEASGDGCILPGVYIIRSRFAVKGGLHVRGAGQTGELMQKTWSYFERPATIIVDTDAGGHIELDAGGLRDLNIISLKACVRPDPTDVWGAYQKMLSWTGTAIVFKPMYSADSRVENCNIIGFERAIDIDYSERFYLRGNRVDCLNGHRFQRIYDVSRLRDDHFWPLWAAHYDFYSQAVTDVVGTGGGRGAHDNKPQGFTYKDTENQTIWARSGAPGNWLDMSREMGRRPGKWLQAGTETGGVDGVLMSGCLAYGYKGGTDRIGASIVAATSDFSTRNYASSFYDMWIDGGFEGTTAVGVAGNTHELMVYGVHVDTHEVGVRLNQTGSVIVRDLTVGGVSYAAVQIASPNGNGVIDGILQGGSIGHLIKVESTAGELTVGGKPMGYAISNLWPTGAVSSMIDCGDTFARRALKIDHKSISRWSGGYDPKLFEGYGQVTLGADQPIPGTDVPTTIGFTNAVQNGLGEWGVDYAHYPWEDNSHYDYLLVLAFKPDNAGPGQFAVDVVRNGTKIFRALQTTISDAELKIFSIPVRLGNSAGQKIQFQIASQVAGYLETDFNNTRITFNRVL